MRKLLKFDRQVVGIQTIIDNFKFGLRYFAGLNADNLIL